MGSVEPAAADDYSSANAADSAVDLLPEEESLICYSFNAETLDEAYGGESGSPVRSAIFQVLQTVRDHAAVRVQASEFIIWEGSHHHRYWVGVSRNAPSAVTGLLAQAFGRVPGFQRPEHGISADLAPAFRYSRGRVFEYTDEQFAGGAYTVDDPGAPAPLRVEYRALRHPLPVALPAAPPAPRSARPPGKAAPDEAESEKAKPEKAARPLSAQPVIRASLFGEEPEPTVTKRRRRSTGGQRRRRFPSPSPQLPLDFGEGDS